MFNPPVSMLLSWESRNWRRLKKATDLCKDYGLTALSKKLFIGNVNKNEIAELKQKLTDLFIGNTDRFFLFMICKSCLEVSSVPAAVQASIAQPLKYEIVG